MESPSQNPQAISAGHEQVTSAQNILAQARQMEALVTEKERAQELTRVRMESALAGLQEHNGMIRRDYFAQGVTFGLGGFLVGIVLFGLGGKDK